MSPSMKKRIEDGIKDLEKESVELSKNDLISVINFLGNYAEHLAGKIENDGTGEENEIKMEHKCRRIMHDLNNQLTGQNIYNPYHAAE